MKYKYLTKALVKKILEIDDDAAGEEFVNENWENVEAVNYAVDNIERSGLTKNAYINQVLALAKKYRATDISE